VSKKERGPFTVFKNYGHEQYTIIGLREYPIFDKDTASQVCRYLNTAYLAGKRSRSKGRGK
jgi:hypothetical protein